MCTTIYLIWGKRFVKYSCVIAIVLSSIFIYGQSPLPTIVSNLNKGLPLLHSLSNSTSDWFAVSSAPTSLSESVTATSISNDPIPCNTDEPIAIAAPNFDDLVATRSTTGVCLPLLGCLATGEQNLIDIDTNNYAEANTAIGLGVTHSFRVEDQTAGEYFEAGTFAGFKIYNSSLVTVDLLNVITIRTYLDGALQETAFAASLLLIDTLLLNPDEYNVGFYTSQNYDAIEISFSSLLNVLSETRIYHAVISQLCPGGVLDCNTPVNFQKPVFPARIDYNDTGLSGIGVGSISNPENVVDSDAGNYANITLLAGILAQATLAVKDDFTDYSENTFVGFDTENFGLLGVDLLDYLTVSTYMDDVFVESKTGASELLSVDTSLLTGLERQRIGFVSTLPFNEVHITISQVIGVDIGTTRVYDMVLEALCDGPIECEYAVIVSNPDYPVIINNSRTGIDGLACIGCEVTDAQNLITEAPLDFANIQITAGVLTTGSISVQNALFDYPVGTRTGFVIRDLNSHLEVDLFNSLTITTYLDGVQQEQETGFASFLTLQLLEIINISPLGSNAYAVGFTVSQPFDEVRLTVASLVGVLNNLEVYGAFTDLRSTELCNDTDAVNDINNTFVDVSVSGNLLINDEDDQGDNQIVTTTGVFPTTAGGSVTINANGTYTYTPALGYAGPDTFQYSIEDDGVPIATDTATVFIEVLTLGVNTTIANADTAGTEVNIPVIGNVLANDFDPEGDNQLVTNTGTFPSIQGGSITIAADGSFTFTPPTDFKGEDTFEYFIIDDNANPAIDSSLLTITINGGPYINRTYANDDAYFENQGATITGNLSDNDSDPEDDNQTVNSAPVSGPTNGILALNTDGSFTYTPIDPNFSGTDQFVYEVTDDGIPVASDQATVYITISDVENLILAIDDINDTYVNLAVTGDVSTNDLNPDGPIGTEVFTIVTGPTTGNLVFNPDGTYTYTPQTDFVGEASFEYQICDGGNPSACDTAIVYIEVVNDPVIGNDPPIANADTNTVEVDTPVTGTVMSNDFDPDGDPITVTNNTQPTNGSVVMNPNGIYTYTPDPGYEGEDIFEYTICDDGAPALCDTTTVTIQVIPDNGNITVANDDAYYAEIGNPINGNVSENDTDPEGDNQLVNIIPVSGPTNGILVLNTDGTFLYTPINPSFVGTDQFVYNVCDDGTPSACDQATVYILIEETPAPTIALIKTGVFTDGNGDQCAAIGDIIAYTFEVTNQGNVDLGAIQVTDPLLEAPNPVVPILYVSGDDGDDLLEANEVWIFEANYVITQLDLDAEEVINQAIAEGTDDDGTTVTDLSDDNTISENDETVTTIIRVAPDPPISGGDQLECEEDPIQTLTATATVAAGQSIIWFDAATNGNIVASPTLNTVGTVTYWAQTVVTVGECISLTRTAVTLTIEPAATAPISTGDIAECEEDPIQTLDGNDAITPTAGQTVVWYDAAVGGNVVASPTLNTVGTITYWAEGVTDGANCSSLTRTAVSLTIEQAATAPISTGDIAECEENPIQTLDANDAITPTAGQTVVWYDAAVGGNVVASPTLNTVGTITYWAEGVTDGANCSSLTRTAVTLTIDSAATAPISTGDIAECEENPIQTLDANDAITPTAGQTVVWYDAASGGNVVASPTLNTVGTITYWAEGVTNGANCSSLTRTSVSLTIEQAATAPISTGDIAECEEDPIQTLDANDAITPTAGQTVVWYDAASGGNIVASPTLNTLGTITYWAEGVTDGANCSSITRTAVSLTIEQAATAPISTGDIAECEENPIQTLDANDAITPTAGQTVVWYDAASGGNVVASPTLNTVGTSTYWAEGETDQASCPSSTRTAVSLTIEQAATAPLSTGDMIECLQDPVQTLDANDAIIPMPGQSIVWYDAPIGGNVLTSATLDTVGTISYWVEGVMDVTQCTSSVRTMVTLTIEDCANSPSLSLEKIGVFNDENGNGFAEEGETISYSFSIINTGDVALYNSTIEDPMPGITIEGEPIAVLLAGETVNASFTARYIITPADIEAEEVINQAVVRAEDANGIQLQDESDDPNNDDNIDPDNDGDPDDPTITSLPVSIGNPFEIFNVVTPNNDNAHDYFQILGIENWPNNNVKIFNRWGVLVWETNGYGGTNGQENVFTGISQARATIRESKELPTGTFYYILSISSDEPPLGKNQHSGHLYINR